MDTDELRSDSDLMAAAEAVLLLRGSYRCDVLAKIFSFPWPRHFVAGATAAEISAGVQTGLMLRIIDIKLS